MLYCIILYYAILYCIVWYYITSYDVIIISLYLFYYIILIILIILYYIILYYTILSYIILFYSTLYYTYNITYIYILQYNIIQSNTHIQFIYTHSRHIDFSDFWSSIRYPKPNGHPAGCQELFLDEADAAEKGAVFEGRALERVFLGSPNFRCSKPV